MAYKLQLVLSMLILTYVRNVAGCISSRPMPCSNRDKRKEARPFSPVAETLQENKDRLSDAWRRTGLFHGRSTSISRAIEDTTTGHKSLIACIRHRDASAAVVLCNVGHAKAAFCVLQQQHFGRCSHSRLVLECPQNVLAGCICFSWPHPLRYASGKQKYDTQ